MAHITYRPAGGHRRQLVINGIDYSNEVFRGVELIEVGDKPEYAEVGLRVTFAVSRLDLGEDENIVVTDQFHQVAQRVRSMSEVGDDE